LAISSFTLSLDEPYWMRFECNQDTLRAKVWEGSVGDEPGSWMLTATDTTYCNCGFMGFTTGHVTSVGDCQAELDNVVVTSLEPLGLETSSWASIKSIPW
jgi:hypothetical protein